MKNKGVEQSHASSRNSVATDVRKVAHATHQVGIWWRAMIIPFRTP